MKPLQFLFFVLSALFFSCGKDDDDRLTVTDIDGNIYHTVKIGDQVWMVENLKTTRYNDGTDIPFITDNTEWENLNTPGYCWYDNDISHKMPYGALYNWYAVNTAKLCPEGWHVPTKDEWLDLFALLGDEDEEDVGKLKELGYTHWESPNTGATNETGLTLLPGGYRDRYGVYLEKGLQGNYYSSTEGNVSDGWAFVFNHDKDSYGTRVSLKKEGYSVRCIKD